MVPEPFNGANVLVKAVEDWPVQTMGPMYDIPGTHKNGLFITAWRPNDHEMALLNGGGVVLLTAVTDKPFSGQVEVMPTSLTVDTMARA